MNSANTRSGSISHLRERSSAELRCLFSHKCGDRAHSIGNRLRVALDPFGIDLKIDPFGIADDFKTRMRTFDIEGVIFLSSPESAASAPVRLELKSAIKQGIPIFTAHLEGPVPALAKTRFYWQVPSTDDPAFGGAVAGLARSITDRVGFIRKVHLLYPENSFHETSAVACSIATQTDRTFLAEFASELVRRYLKLSDPTTRYWIALALGRANTRHSAKLLDQLPTPGHPLVVEGIRQAREMVGRDAPESDPQPANAS